MIRILLLGILLLLPPVNAYAVNPGEMLSDPVLEGRAREISKGLRCLVCQNQSIDDSDASLARDLRVLVRERLSAGDSDQQVVDYIVSRYGDFVLLKPPFMTSTLVLWLGPLVLVLIGLYALFRMYGRFRVQAGVTAGAPPLTDDEQRRLNKLLEGSDS